MLPRARWRLSLAVAAVLLFALGAGGLALAPDEDRLCTHLLGLARAAGEDLDAAGVDDGSCREVLQRRRAKMGPVRRFSYGICVVMAVTLDEIGRC